ncbi:hypothetical protein [Ochrobactrum quorumnocens]|uniref:hypothetical protein n=1 Tax=Ochrobactrum quorumnocens TaxID=271865 RepID=UPI003BA25980
MRPNVRFIGQLGPSDKLPDTIAPPVWYLVLDRHEGQADGGDACHNRASSYHGETISALRPAWYGVTIGL